MLNVALNETTIIFAFNSRSNVISSSVTLLLKITFYPVEQEGKDTCLKADPSSFQSFYVKHIVLICSLFRRLVNEVVQLTDYTFCKELSKLRRPY